MRVPENLVGRKFGKLSPVKIVSRDKNGYVKWLCVCDCGNETIVYAANLKKGNTKTCGCYSIDKNILQMTHRRFGKLSTIKIDGQSENGEYLWKCKCDCGIIITVKTSSLKNGNTKSCGCLTRQPHKNRLSDLFGKRFGRLVVIEDTYKNKHGSALWKCLCDCGNSVIVRRDMLLGEDVRSCGCYSRDKKFERFSGKNHPNWMDGKSKEPYSPKWTDVLKEQIRNRDNRQCQFPECQHSDLMAERKLDVHHIDGNKKNCKPENLVSLCRKHHMWIERHNPEMWMYYFQELLKDYE